MVHYIGTKNLANVRVLRMDTLKEYVKELRED